MYDSTESDLVLEEAPTLTTRRSFLKTAGIGGATVVAGSALVGAVAGSARAGHSDSVPDVDVLNFALTLEYLEAEFYTQALGGSGTIGVPGSSGRFNRGAITGTNLFAGEGGRIRSQVYDNLIAIRDHEITHVDFLRNALGGAAVGPCTFNFSGALSDVGAFLSTAQLLENTGVMAYDGAIRYVDNGDNLQAGAQIATVEARHAAYLNLINGTSPFPSAFDTGLPPSKIYAAASGFIVSCPPAVVALIGRLP